MLDLGVISSVAGVLGLSAQQLWQMLQVSRAKAKNDLETGRMAALIEATRRYTTEGWSARFTERFYPDKFLKEAGLVRYGARIGEKGVLTSLATRPEWVGTRIPLRSDAERCILETSCTDPIVPVPEDSAAILADLEARGVRVWNAPIFRLLNVTISKRELQAQFCLDEFFRYRLTSGSLPDELIQALVDTDFNLNSIVSDRERLLPRRIRYLPATSSIGDFAKRMCATGVNVLTAFARPAPANDFAVILQRRAQSVSTRQGALSVVPGGHHQPMLDPDAEVSLSRTIMRELFEEVFGGEEAQKRCTRLSVDWYEKACEPLKWFTEHKGAFDLFMTGAGFSLVTGSATFAAVLVVRDEGFWERYCHEMRTNWEVSSDLTPALSTKGPDMGRVLSSLEWTDYAFQALIEGILFLRETSPNRVDTPEIKREPSGN